MLSASDADESVNVNAEQKSNSQKNSSTAGGNVHKDVLQFNLIHFNNN